MTGLLSGALPALVASKPNLNESLKETGRQSSPGFSGRGAHGVLVVTEVALSLVLLIGAGLMIHAIWGLVHVDIGFNPKKLIAMTINLPEDSYCKDGPKERTLKPQAPRYASVIRMCRLMAEGSTKLVYHTDRSRTTARNPWNSIQSYQIMNMMLKTIWPA